jgi:hypothetical protein
MGSVASTLSSPAAAVSAAPAVERSFLNKTLEVQPGMEDRADRFERYKRRLGSVNEALNPTPTEEEEQQFGSNRRRRSRRTSKKITRRRK